MIAPAQTKQPQILSVRNKAQFLLLLPQIRDLARRAFRRLHPELRDDLIAEVIGGAFCAYVSLIRRGRENNVYATPLANFAIRQAIAGRRVGSSSRLSDVSSPFARAARGILVERLDDGHSEWRAALVEDRRATPADIAAARIDVAAWFHAMPDSHRQIAQALAMGETTSEAAKQFGLSRARVSQLRGQLKASWEEFQGEAKPHTV